MTTARTLRIFSTDPDATDSSSGDEEACSFSSHREGRLIKEVCLEPTRRPTTGGGAGGQIAALCRSIQRKRRMNAPVTGCGGVASPPGRTKIGGVRLRPWGRYAAEIRDTAAVVYDREAIRIRGCGAATNFSASASIFAGYDSAEDSRRLPTPTSVLLGLSSPCSAAKGEPTRERRNGKGDELIGGARFRDTVVPVERVPLYGDLSCLITWEPTVFRKPTRIGFAEEDDYFQDIGDLFPLEPLPAMF